MANGSDDAWCFDAVSRNRYRLFAVSSFMRAANYEYRITWVLITPIQGQSDRAISERARRGDVTEQEGSLCAAGRLGALPPKNCEPQDVHCNQ